jgi:hypothetical protein
MAKNTPADFDLTSTNNTDVLGQSTAGSATVSTLDSIVQKFMTTIALFYDQVGGVGTVGGTADAITLATNGTYPFQSLASGLICSFKAGSANTGAATINVDSLGAKAIRRQGDSALSANDILANGVYLIRYDTAYNSAAGAWVLLNPSVSSTISGASTTTALTGTDTSSYITADALAALWEKGTDEASSGTVSFGEGGFFHITGTTTITDLDFDTAKNGRAVDVVFDGVLTLTHNSTTLKLPGNASITTAAGDRARFVQDASDNVVCLYYTRADGTAVIASTSYPVPTSSTLAVGTAAMLINNSGGDVTSNSTVGGSNLNIPITRSDTGQASSGSAQTGTWKNISGGTVADTRIGYFVRTV